MGISIFITVLVCTFLGLWMFFSCLYSNRILAVALSVGIAVLIFFVENSFPQFRYLAARLAPSVWMEVARAKMFENTDVLKSVSITCKSDHIYGTIGHNGSGKTVLFKCICRFLRCDKGEILVNGKVMGKGIDMLTNAGVIIEEPGFLRKWSGYHNLEVLFNMRNKNDKMYLYAVIEKVSLDPRLRRPVEKYSLGMRQRLAIAQAIMEKPDTLILDEPMNGLDKKGTQEMRDLFLQMKEEGKLILLASHNREDIDILCDEVYEMEDGILTKMR